MGSSCRHLVGNFNRIYNRYVSVMFCTNHMLIQLSGKILIWAEPKKLHDQQLLVALTIALGFGLMGGATLLGVDGFLVVIVGGIMYLLRTCLTLLC